MSDEVSNKHTWAHRGHGRSTFTVLGDEIAIGLHRPIVIITSQVLYANAHPPVSHMSPNFTAIFGESIRMTRYVRISHPDMFTLQANTQHLFHIHVELERLSGRQPHSRFLSPDLGHLDGIRQALHIPPSSFSRPTMIQMFRFRPTS
jgi:hypothetical protein